MSRIEYCVIGSDGIHRIFDARGRRVTVDLDEAKQVKSEMDRMVPHRAPFVIHCRTVSEWEPIKEAGR